MQDEFDFIWRRGHRPYFVTEFLKIVKLIVKGDIPYLFPGAPECQPVDPDDECPLPPWHTKAAGPSPQALVATVEVSVQTDHHEGGAIMDAVPGASSSSSSSSAAPPAPSLAHGLGPKAKEAGGSGNDGEDTADEPIQLGDPHELSYDDQMAIVPPPKPHKDARLRLLAKTVPHILIHKPFNPHCSICRGAKLREAPHRKGSAAKVLEDAKEFGDYVTGDFLASKGEVMRGVGG